MGDTAFCGAVHGGVGGEVAAAMGKAGAAGREGRNTAGISPATGAGATGRHGGAAWTGNEPAAGWLPGGLGGASANFATSAVGLGPVSGEAICPGLGSRTASLPAFFPARLPGMAGVRTMSWRRWPSPEGTGPAGRAALSPASPGGGASSGGQGAPAAGLGPALRSTGRWPLQWPLVGEAPREEGITDIRGELFIIFMINMIFARSFSFFPGAPEGSCLIFLNIKIKLYLQWT